MLGTVHLMWRQQPLNRYFGVFLPSNVSVRRSYMVGTSWSTLIMVQVSNYTVFNRSKEYYLLEKLSCYFPDPKFQRVNLGSLQSLILFPRQFRFVDIDQDSTLINLGSHKPKAHTHKFWASAPTVTNKKTFMLILFDLEHLYQTM